MLDQILTPQQLAVISALSSGATMTQAAEEAGVHRNTINNWRRNSHFFQQALAEAQYDQALYFREQAEALIPQAFEAINQILADPKTPAGVRLKAALALIELATTPPPPKKQIELVLSTPEPSKPVPSPKPAPQPAKEAAPIVHNPAPPLPYRRESPKIGRNEACPCGSGQKHKRCCLNKPLATAA
jgi:uncharacterized protein YecA (UPF0149 family)